MRYSIGECVKTNLELSTDDWTIPNGEHGIISSCERINSKFIYRVQFDRLELVNILIYEDQLEKGKMTRQ